MLQWPFLLFIVKVTKCVYSVHEFIIITHGRYPLEAHQNRGWTYNINFGHGLIIRYMYIITHNYYCNRPALQSESMLLSSLLHREQLIQRKVYQKAMSLTFSVSFLQRLSQSHRGQLPTPSLPAIESISLTKGPIQDNPVPPLRLWLLPLMHPLLLILPSGSGHWLQTWLVKVPSENRALLSQHLVHTYLDNLLLNSHLLVSTMHKST